MRDALFAVWKRQFTFSIRLCFCAPSAGIKKAPLPILTEEKGGEATMEVLSSDFAENTRTLDALLGVGRCFDMIARDLVIGARRARLWVIDGYGDDAVLERMLSFWLALPPLADGMTMQQFIDRCV